MTFEPAPPLSVMRATRTSIKWRRFADDILPLFVAEMDFGVAPEITAVVTDALATGDTGYLEGPGPLAPAFADFALRSWGWHVDQSHVHVATDVTVGVVETLRLVVLPNLRASVVGASFLTATVVLGEFTIASLLLKDTLPLYMAQFGQREPQGGMALALVSLLATALLLAVITSVSRRRGAPAAAAVL